MRINCQKLMPPYRRSSQIHKSANKRKATWIGCEFINSKWSGNWFYWAIKSPKMTVLCWHLSISARMKISIATWRISVIKKCKNRQRRFLLSRPRSRAGNAAEPHLVLHLNVLAHLAGRVGFAWRWSLFRANSQKSFRASGRRTALSYRFLAIMAVSGFAWK